MDDTVQERLEFQKTEAHDISLLPTRLLRRPHMLQLIAGGAQPRSISLGPDEVTIGRSNSADVRIMSADLSRQHAKVRKTPWGYQIEDLGSRNGVYVNEVRAHTCILRDGDTVQLGNVVLIYLEGN